MVHFYSLLCPSFCFCIATCFPSYCGFGLCTCMSVVLQLFVKTSRSFMSGIPRRAWPIIWHYKTICTFFVCFWDCYTTDALLWNYFLFNVFRKTFIFLLPSNSEDMDWQYISITTCMNFIWCYCPILTWCFWSCYYYQLFTFRYKGINICHLAVIFNFCFLFFMDHTPTPLLFSHIRFMWFVFQFLLISPCAGHHLHGWLEP